MKPYFARPVLTFFIAAAVAGALVFFAWPKPAAPFSWCPKGQKAILTGFGREADGTYLATYGCEK